MTLLHFAGFGMFWGGLEAWNGGLTTTTTAGDTTTGGTHIVYIDDNHHVDIQVASADTIRIHNGGSIGTLAGNVTLIW